MKNKIIIAAAVAAATALIISLVKRMKVGKRILQPIPLQKSRHRTDVFAHAKNHAT
jgi:hypothetical protein